MLGSLTATVIEDNGAADVVLTGGAVPAAVYDGRTATDKDTLGTEQSFKLLASTDNTGAIMSATGPDGPAVVYTAGQVWEADVQRGRHLYLYP